MIEMPKAKNPHKCYCDKYSPHTMTKGQVARDAHYHGFEEGSNARAKLLAEQGYRPVPSEEGFIQKFRSLLNTDNDIELDTDMVDKIIATVEDALKKLHRGLLGA